MLNTNLKGLGEMKKKEQSLTGKKNHHSFGPLTHLIQRLMIKYAKNISQKALFLYKMPSKEKLLTL